LVDGPYDAGGVHFTDGREYRFCGMTFQTRDGPVIKVWTMDPTGWTWLGEIRNENLPVLIDVRVDPDVPMQTFQIEQGHLLQMDRG